MIPYTFTAARPVWGRGLGEVMNVTLVFSADVPAGQKTLRAAACTDYQIFLDGEFFAAGPARAGHGYFRVDELALPEQACRVEIHAASYHVNSYYLLDGDPFLCAEIVSGGAVLAATGVSGFSCVRDCRRVRRVQRYSFQRPFAEAYRLAEEAARPVEQETVAPRRFIAREVPYPDYETTPAALAARGAFTLADPEKFYDDRAISRISPVFKGYRPEELDVFISRETERIRCAYTDRTAHPAGEAFELPASGCALADLGRELTGFIALDVEAEERCRLTLTFDEILTDGDVSFLRFGTCSAVVWELTPGRHRLLTFEPYSARWLRLAAAGRVRVSGLRMIRYEFPAAPLREAPRFADADLEAIYDAAVATFRQNTVDVYMDCPSRERAGWLCDSFFTARTEYALTGKTTVERAFLENFLMPQSFEALPAGMLPMCYPSDHNNGNHIPNWAMWYVLELEEYVYVRGGDAALAEAAKEKMYALLAYLRRYENERGLLERLPGWVFVEWSRANDLVQDINYPTNMLYCRCKRALAHLYGDGELAREADALAAVIREESYRDGWFCDNAVYGADGRAALSGERTEVCQYYAFFTGVASRETYPALWETLVRDFGPRRREDNRHPAIHFANAFIGNFLRLELLERAGLHAQLLEETRGYFGYMAERTGTLWENVSATASCNHGFASHAAVWLLNE